MVDRAGRLAPPVPPGRGRPSASKGRRAVARLVVVVLVLAGASAAAWLAVSAVRGSAAEPPPPPPATTGPPPLPTLKIVFPEGFTREQMAQRIAAVNRIARDERGLTTRLRANDYLDRTKRHPVPQQFPEARGKPLEGFLFPATYDFTPETTTRELVERQLEAFERSWAEIDLGYARSRNLTPYDVLIIASMVEKETIAPQERPLVAAVIYNRLRHGMPLGIDATIRYGLGVPPTESLRQSHLQSDNPYNTRRHVGLPPTPIANPGLASMQAAAHPADVDFLYFARKPDRVHHFFTASEREFLRYLCEHGYGCG